MCKTICAAILLAASIATIVAVCIVYIPKDHDNGKGLKVKVTNPAAFEAGGASHHPAKEENGVGAGTDNYILYSGKAASFPSKDKWVSFKDMWDANKEKTIKTSCSDLHYGKDNSYACRIVDAAWRMLLTESREKETEYLHDAIQSVAKASLVDNRLILAIVMQESKGCVRVKGTRSNSGISNPGLMQSHNGTSYNPEKSKETIFQMLLDGTDGTQHGKGLVQYLDIFGNPYAAARGYNSGAVAPSGDLSDAIGATTCYASDVANRLLGWVKAPTKCGSETASKRHFEA